MKKLCFTLALTLLAGTTVAQTFHCNADVINNGYGGVKFTGSCVGILQPGDTSDMNRLTSVFASQINICQKPHQANPKLYNNQTSFTNTSKHAVYFTDAAEEINYTFLPKNYNCGSNY